MRPSAYKNLEIRPLTPKPVFQYALATKVWRNTSEHIGDIIKDESNITDGCTDTQTKLKKKQFLAIA